MSYYFLSTVTHEYIFQISYFIAHYDVKEYRKAKFIVGGLCFIIDSLCFSL